MICLVVWFGCLVGWFFFTATEASKYIAMYVVYVCGFAVSM